jgi:hypothetical protein
MKPRNPLVREQIANPKRNAGRHSPKPNMWDELLCMPEDRTNPAFMSARESAIDEQAAEYEDKDN